MEVIHREVKGGTKINCYLKEYQSQFSETRRLKDFGEEDTQNSIHEGSRVTHCVDIEEHQQKTLSADEAHVTMKRRTDRRCVSATVDFGWRPSQ